jgi:hypothetical protein
MNHRPCAARHELFAKVALNALMIRYVKEPREQREINAVTPGYGATELPGGRPTPGVGDSAGGLPASVQRQALDGSMTRALHLFVRLTQIFARVPKISDTLRAATSARSSRTNGATGPDVGMPLTDRGGMTHSRTQV